MRNASIIFVLLCLPVTSLAQGKKLRSFTAEAPVQTVAIDRPGDFYLVLQNGMLQRFNPQGEKLSQHKFPTAPTLFDPRDGAREFLFFGHEGKYIYLNAEFDLVHELHLDSSFAINPQLLCPAGDHELWILDSADYSLKRTVLMGTSVKSETEISAALRQKSKFTYMREYQNFLFLLDEHAGILIFNGMGKHIKTVGQAGMHTFNFIGEELYFLQDGKIIFFNLFSGDTRETPLSQPADFVLVGEAQILLVHGREVTIAEFKP